MRRPGSTKNTVTSGFRPEIAQGLVDYFTAALDRAKAAKASGSTALVKWPTVVGYCDVVRIKHNTLRGWGRRLPEMRQALTEVARIRVEISALELETLVFDTEWQP